MVGPLFFMNVASASHGHAEKGYRTNEKFLQDKLTEFEPIPKFVDLRILRLVSDINVDGSLYDQSGPQVGFSRFAPICTCNAGRWTSRN